MEGYPSTFQPFDEDLNYPWTDSAEYHLPPFNPLSPITPPTTRHELFEELKNAKKEIELLKAADPFRTAEMALEIQVDKAHVMDLVKARDVVVSRLCDAYASLREKVLRVEQLSAEKEVLEKRLETSVGGATKEEAKEIAKLEGLIRMLREEIKWLKAGSRKGHAVEWLPHDEDLDQTSAHSSWSLTSQFASLSLEPAHNQQKSDNTMTVAAFNSNLLLPGFPPPLSCTSTSRSPSPSPTLAAAASFQSSRLSSSSPITPDVSFGSHLGVAPPSSPSTDNLTDRILMGNTAGPANALGLSSMHTAGFGDQEHRSSFAQSFSAPAIVMTSAPPLAGDASNAQGGSTSYQSLSSAESLNSLSIQRDGSATSQQFIPLSPPSSPPISGGQDQSQNPNAHVMWCPQDLLEAHETIAARHAVLAELSIPSNIPLELQPIVIPQSLTLHEFLGTASGSLRNALSNYRVFQHTTTAWCPEREEHGYYLTPVYKCTTNPRMAHAHRWAEVDVRGRMGKPTECFFNKEGKWYYAGVYRAFRMADLTTKEWDGLSTETSTAIIKDALAGRKNISPQNTYEVTQLFACGALKVACVGLQCIGFNMGLYRTILEAADRCTGRAASAGTGGQGQGQGGWKASPSPSPGSGSGPGGALTNMPRPTSTTPTPTTAPPVHPGAGRPSISLQPSSSAPALSPAAWPALSPSKGPPGTAPKMGPPRT